MHLSPPVALAAIRSKAEGSVVVYSFLIVIPIVKFCNCSMFCCALLCVQVLQSSRWGGESWLLCFVCLSGVS